MTYLNVNPFLLRKSFELVHENAFCHVGGIVWNVGAIGSKMSAECVVF